MSHGPDCSVVASPRPASMPGFRRRYEARLTAAFEGGEATWGVWDTLHNGPRMSATDEADAIASVEHMNAGAPDIADGYLKSVMPEMDDLGDDGLPHLRRVVAREIEGKDKYAIAAILAERIEYASDRMHEFHLVHIQLLFEALAAANGYAPVPVLGLSESASDAVPDPSAP